MCCHGMCYVVVVVVVVVLLGTYELEMVVNANRKVRELNYDNNSARATVVIP